MTIRKAIGAVKDRTSIHIAKSSSNMSPSLQVAIVKATSHHKDPADEKYIREIVNMVSSRYGHVQTCVAVSALSKRLSKTKDWIVAIKSLILVHRLLVEADPLFQHEIMHSCTKRGTRVLNMKDFRDDAHANSGDYSKFVKSYALYLDQKLELTMFERSICGGGDGMGHDYSHVGSFKDPVMMITSKLYMGINYDSVAREDEKKAVSPLREMRPVAIFAKMGLLQGLLDRVLACRPSGMTKHCRLVSVAIRPIVRESFKLYADICEVLEILFDNFFEMEYSCSVKAFNVYGSVAKQIDELIHFYNWCNDVGLCSTYETPNVKRITDKQMETIRDILRNRSGGQENATRDAPPAPEYKEPEEPCISDVKAISPPEDLKEILCDWVEELKCPERKGPVPVPPQYKEPDEPYMNGIKAIPPPPDPQPEPDHPKPQKCTGDLINLMDEWQAMPYDGHSNVITPVRQSPISETGKTDWETALVESANNLSVSDQKNAMSFGFNPVLLSGMYDQHTSSLALAGGSASRQGLTPVLLLPAPFGSFQIINQNAFLASQMNRQQHASPIFVGQPPPQMMPYWIPPGGYYYPQ